MVVRVAAVDHRVAGREQRQQICERRVDDARRDHEPDEARRLELLDEVRERRRSGRALASQFLDRRRCCGCTPPDRGRRASGGAPCSHPSGLDRSCRAARAGSSRVERLSRLDRSAPGSIAHGPSHGLLRTWWVSSWSPTSAERRRISRCSIPREVRARPSRPGGCRRAATRASRPCSPRSSPSSRWRASPTPRSRWRVPSPRDAR